MINRISAVAFACAVASSAYAQLGPPPVYVGGDGLPQAAQGFACLNWDGSACSFGAGGGGGSAPSAIAGSTFPATVSPGGLNIAGVARGWNGAALAAGAYAGLVVAVSGSGATAAMPTIPGNGYGVALTAGSTGTRVYLPSSTDSVTYAVEAAAACGTSAPGPTVTISGAQAANIDENLSGVVMCLTAMTGGDLRVRAY